MDIEWMLKISNLLKPLGEEWITVIDPIQILKRSIVFQPIKVLFLIRDVVQLKVKLKSVSTFFLSSKICCFWQKKYKIFIFFPEMYSTIWKCSFQFKNWCNKYLRWRSRYTFLCSNWIFQQKELWCLHVSHLKVTFPSQFIHLINNFYSSAGSHGPEYLTDAHNPSQSTWWQSETIYDGVQYPNQVNLTLNLGKYRYAKV